MLTKTIQTIYRIYRLYRSLPHRVQQCGLIGVAILCLVLGISSHSWAATTTVKSAAGNYCIDLEHNNTTPGTAINSRGCNHSQAQNWIVNHDSISHGDNVCLSVAGDATAVGSKIVAATCSDAPGQVWLQNQQGLINPNSGLCLTTPTSTSGQLTINDCTVPTNQRQQWIADNLTPAVLSHQCTQLQGGERVACYAELEWSNWQNSPDHKDQLYTYTAGSPDESWCADFVSYVYREAGKPFTGGEVYAWDVAAAYQIKTQGFTMHDPEDYTPKPGDVAVFNYNGGHVELVIKGGKHPTFLYGNSGTIDPTTGNGKMAANTITRDEPNGELIYYLSKD